MDDQVAESNFSNEKPSFYFQFPNLSQLSHWEPSPEEEAGCPGGRTLHLWVQFCQFFSEGPDGHLLEKLNWRKGNMQTSPKLLDIEYKWTLILRNPEHHHDTPVWLEEFGNQVVHTILANSRSQWVSPLSSENYLVVISLVYTT